MRSREEIERHWNASTVQTDRLNILKELLLDVRDLLVSQNDTIVIPDDFGWPKWSPNQIAKKFAEAIGWSKKA